MNHLKRTIVGCGYAIVQNNMFICVEYCENLKFLKVFVFLFSSTSILFNHFLFVILFPLNPPQLTDFDRSCFWICFECAKGLSTTEWKKGTIKNRFWAVHLEHPEILIFWVLFFFAFFDPKSLHCFKMVLKKWKTTTKTLF